MALVPKLHKELNVKIGNEQEQPIHHLGDGLQQILIITFAAFSAKEEYVNIYIEEPELYLHPGMQRRLLEVLTSKRFSNIQFYLTTHSNHLLDMTMDFISISIYSFRKNVPNETDDEVLPTFSITNVSNADLNLLSELGVHNSSVFLANCTIWVEGPTDRHYIRHFMKLYYEHKQRESSAGEAESEISRYRVLREDFEYAFVEYGGNNITHWSFLDDEEKPMNVKRICSRLILIADSDAPKEGSKKSIRPQKLAETLGENFLQLPCREIENLVSVKVLRAVVEDYEGGDENIRNDISTKTLLTKSLGKFIEGCVLTDRTKSCRFTEKMKEENYKIGPYAAASGTIKDKNEFQKKVLHHTRSYDDLSDEAKEFTQKLVKLIRAAIR